MKRRSFIFLVAVAAIGYSAQGHSESNYKDSPELIERQATVNRAAQIYGLTPEQADQVLSEAALDASEHGEGGGGGPRAPSMETIDSEHGEGGGGGPRRAPATPAVTGFQYSGPVQSQPRGTGQQ